MRIKRIFYIAVSALALLFGILFFVNKNNDISSKKEVNFCIEKNAEVKINGFNLECKISRTFTGLTDLTINSPESLKNMRFSWLGDHQEIALGKVINKSKEDMLPTVNFPGTIFKILNHASKAEKKFGRINSTVEGVNYILDVDNNGEIKLIKAPSINLEVKF